MEECLRDIANDVITKSPWADVRAFGADSRGIKDSTQAIQEAVNTGRPVFLPSGTYKINGAIRKTTEDSIYIYGIPGKTVIDGTESTDETLLNFGGYRGNGAKLLADAMKGGSVVNTDLPLTAGDVLLITSTELWCPNRPYYYKGELVRVNRIDGKNINLACQLCDHYSANTTLVYKLLMPQVTVHGLTIKRNSNQAGLQISYAHNLNVENCYVTGARERGIYVSYCYGGTIRANRVDDCWYSGTGTSYSLVIATSQFLNIENNELQGGRNGIANGGWEPNRYNRFTGNIVDNYHLSGRPSVSFHENNEYITVENNTILNGISPTCKNITIKNNNLFAENQEAVYYNMLVEECRYFTVENNVIRGQSMGVVIGFRKEAQIIEEVTIDNNIIETLMDGIRINPELSSCQNCRIKRLVLRDNKVIAEKSYALLTYAEGGDNKAWPKFDNVQVIDGLYNSKKSGHSVALYCNPDEPGELRIENSRIITEGYGQSLELYDFNYASVKNCHIGSITSGGGWTNTVRGKGRLQIVGNTFSNWTVNGGLTLSNWSTVEGSYNIFENCTDAISLVGVGTYVHILGLSAYMPSTGQHLKGEIYYNSQPTASGYIGWICIQEGIPGVWKGFGKINA